jgi:probable phosphoglycerate mutase
MGELVLIRHGETEWTLSGQHTSYTDIPLTEHGEEQARTLAPLLAARHIACVLTSPLQRARDTAKLAGLDRTRVDPDLHEWDYGGYEGVTTRTIHKDRPGWDLWTDGVAPGPDGHPGESAEQVGERADRVLARVDAAFANGEGGDVVLVAHAHFLRVLTARRLGLPPADGALFQLATGTVSRLGMEHGRHVLTAWNRLP